jgi:hypothetical protein
VGRQGYWNFGKLETIKNSGIELREDSIGILKRFRKIPEFDEDCDDNPVKFADV